MTPVATLDHHPEPIGKPKILIVDDEPIIVRRLSTILSQLGYAVFAFTDSDEAVSALERERFDLVITDIVMRKNDGAKIIETARHHDNEAKVLVITGSNGFQATTWGHANGVMGCLLKPFRIEELKDAINRVLAQSSLPASGPMLTPAR